MNGRVLQAVLAVLTLVAVALAGCSDGGSPGPTGSPTGSPGPSSSPGPTPSSTPPTREPITRLDLLLDFAMTGCTGMQLAQTVPLADAAALLPDGVRPKASLPVPLPDLPADPDTLPVAFGSIEVQMVHCEAFSTPRTSLPDVWTGWVRVPIEAPTDLLVGQDLTGDRHEYVLEMLAGDNLTRALWPAAAYPTHNGTSADQGVTVLASTTGLWSMNIGEYVLSGETLRATTAPAGPHVLRYHLLPNGDWLLWSGDEEVSFSDTGIGSLDVPEGSPFVGMGPDGSDTLRGQVGAMAVSGFTGQDLVRILAVPL